MIIWVDVGIFAESHKRLVEAYLRGAPLQHGAVLTAMTVGFIVVVLIHAGLSLCCLRLKDQDCDDQDCDNLYTMFDV